jgi:hypothetical protein
MRILTVTKKVLWPEARWREYVGLLCGARRIAFDFVMRFPDTAGLKALDLRPFLQVEYDLACAALRLEDVVVDHMGGEWAVPDGAIRFVMGDLHGQGGAGNTFLTRVHGRSRPADPPLSREQWTHWGSRAKEAQRLILRMIADVREARGSEPHLAQLRAADRALDRGRAKLNSLLNSQHPRWHERVDVFFEHPATAGTTG